MYIAWSNIERIGSYRRLLFKAEGLYLKSKDGIKGWLKIPLVIGRAFIPLTIFVPTWRDSQLGQIIYHHVPNLFKELEGLRRYF